MVTAGKIQGLFAKSEELRRSSSANEANTKALLIEPLLRSLGWDTDDLTQVAREHRVFDGTFLDYALMIDGGPRVFVEAKAIGQSLDAKQFIAQAVNYANNEGVIWCVLTNGATYRVYKANEPVSMEQKLLFEVSLSEAEQGRAGDVAKALTRIAPPEIASGTLDRWGEQLFADERVRKVLAQLAADPPEDLTALVASRLGQPPLASPLLESSLGRVLGSDGPEQSALIGGSAGPSDLEASKKPNQPTKPKRPPKAEWSLDHHFAGKPALIRDLFEQTDAFARGLGGDVSRRIRKFYVGYFVGKRSFFTAELQRTRIWIYLNLDPTDELPGDTGSLRDVRKIGHYGLGDTEYSLSSASQLDDVKALVALAYTRTR